MSELKMIPIGELKPNKDNPRKVGAGVMDDSALVASIDALGLLQPLLVEPNGSGYTVVDGNRRLKALRDLKFEGPVACQIRNAADAPTLELAVAANVVRAAMHPLDECDAIDQLVKKDLSIDEIAAHFAKPEAWVRQRMALANLCPKAKELCREGHLSIAGAVALTLASVKDQESYLRKIKVLKDGNVNDPHALLASSIRWHFTSDRIPAKKALFDLANYPAKSIVRDLFAEGDEGVWLTDIKEFVHLQETEIAVRIENIRQEGWAEVKVLPKADYNVTGRYVEVQGDITQKKRAKLTCIVIADPLAFEIKENMALRKQVEKEKLKKNKAGGDETAEVEDVKPATMHELSEPQRVLCNRMMSVAVYEELVFHDDVAMWTLIGPLLGGFNPPWSNVRLGSYADREGKDVAGETFNVRALAKEYLSTWEGKIPQTLADFEALTDAKKRTLMRMAAAQAINTQTAAAAVLKEWELTGWFRPTLEFLNKYRKDQLLHFGRKLGMSKETLEDAGNKTALVEAIFNVCQEDGSAIPVPKL